MAETVEEAASKYVKRLLREGMIYGDAACALASRDFQTGAAWQAEQDSGIVQEWIDVCRQKDAELAAIREKARGIRDENNPLTMQTFIMELAGGVSE